MVLKKKLSVLILLLTGSLLAVFNSCSPEHTGNANGAFSSNLSCETADEISLFSTTFHPFLKQYCVNCHVPGGAGPGDFASSGLLVAYNSFEIVGFSRIAEYAIDNGHNPPYTGAQHTERVNELREQWAQGLEVIQSCQYGGNSGLDEEQDAAQRLQTRVKAINPSAGRTTITWRLDQELLDNPEATMPNVPGAEFSITVDIMERPGQFVYVVSNPTISSPNVDVHVESLLIKINGKAAPAQRTFYYVNRDIRAWNDQHPDFNAANATELRAFNNTVSDGSMVAEGEIRTSDLISISFGKIEATVLPPREEFPEIQFVQAAQTMPNEDGVVSVDVQLSRAWSELAVVDIEFGPNTTMREECCTIVQDENFSNIEVQNFDRDFEVLDNARLSFQDGNGTPRSVLRVSFSPGETQKTLRFQLVPDDRDELDEAIHLRFDPNSFVKSQAGSVNQEHTLTVTDNDAPYTGTARTYQQLMRTGGVLNTYCIRCHNSVDNRGGYDLTNYKQMIDEGILIPGDANSIMYLRMNTDDGVLDPMPLEGLITDTRLRRQVEDWIIGGAPNN